jgi:predicted porin
MTSSLKTIALSAILAGAAALAPAAADDAANCCADLEERVAELEATAVRKGNRKVSVTLSGYVAQQITAWDDGGESNIYLWGLGPTQATNFRLSGNAKIAPGWTAGYVLRLQNLTDNPFGSSQIAESSNNGLGVQFSYWRLASEKLGSVQVGLQAPASKSVAMFTDLSGSQLPANYVLFDGAGFFLRRGDGTLSNVTWGNLGFCYSIERPFGGDCNGVVQNVVRYDSPVIGGFQVSASWGEDDLWDVAAKFARDVAGFKLSLGVAYTQHTDENQSPFVAPGKDISYVQAGFYAQHILSGLFIHGAYGGEDTGDSLLLNGARTLDGDHFYVKAGLRRKLTSLGNTVLFGDYAEYHDQLGPAALAAGATGGDFTRWGGGVVQEIESAAMSLWLKYRRHEADIVGAATLGDIRDADFVGVGGVINF